MLGRGSFNHSTGNDGSSERRAKKVDTFVDAVSLDSWSDQFCHELAFEILLKFRLGQSLIDLKDRGGSGMMRTLRTNLLAPTLRALTRAASKSSSCPTSATERFRHTISMGKLLRMLVNG